MLSIVLKMLDQLKFNVSQQVINQARNDNKSSKIFSSLHGVSIHFFFADSLEGSNSKKVQLILPDGRYLGYGDKYRTKNLKIYGPLEELDNTFWLLEFLENADDSDFVMIKNFANNGWRLSSSYRGVKQEWKANKRWQLLKSVF